MPCMSLHEKKLPLENGSVYNKQKRQIYQSGFLPSRNVFLVWMVDCELFLGSLLPTVYAL